MKRVALGMSGGVDSSVSAVLLQEQGYDVTGVFLECWRAPGCRAEEDRKDALGIALQRGIPFEVLDFKKQYKEKVVEYFFTEYSAGRTPNPDVLCNKEIKFGMFYDWAMAHGFDGIATGHYARVGVVDGQKALLRGTDEKKDQSYFLYLLHEEQLEHILFPIGHMKKSEVRMLAEKHNLSVAKKPDSQGICFIGEINVHSFLKERLGENPGVVVNTKGEVIGEHNGLWFYTIGQRHGFTLRGKIRSDHHEWKHVIPPFYVIAKDAEHNTLIVGYGEETLRDRFIIHQTHWIGNAPRDQGMHVRIRHGGALLPATITQRIESEDVEVRLTTSAQGIAEGQSAVLYKNVTCLGGGVIQ
ncbi:MAG: tRNA 2-thiouridine(34) synthase MnmA [Candidatus Pacebacteria bacterium]|nr:tRNA 2-thiouridine(34) synthase MnmA [Candidatus Paceibacterota bacterium]